MYFPGYGWVTFDPTGGGVGRLTVLPAGPALESAAPTAAASRPINEGEELDPISGGVFPETRVEQNSGGLSLTSGPLLTIGLLLAIFVGAAVIVARRRAQARRAPPDAIYNSVARFASQARVRAAPDRDGL